MKRLWGVDELLEHWTLLPDDTALLANKTGATRLGFAALLKAFRHDGRFPAHKGDVPGAVVAHLAKQVGVPTSAWLAYDWRGRASEYHRAQIREALGFRSATVQDAEELAHWLATVLAPHEDRPDQLQAAAYARCRTLHLEPPTPARVERLARAAWQVYEASCCATTFGRLPQGTRDQLDALLAEADPATPEAVTLHDLRTDPGRAGLDSILRELAKLRRIRELQLPQKLYRPTAGQPDAFPGLAPILTRPVNWELIARQYDELVKYATALRLGTAETEAILRRFTRSNVQHPTYQALAELGKAVKTIFLCDYLRSAALRREIQEGLNVAENWNSANSFIFYGKGGEIAANRLEDQEVAVLALHLLQVYLVYINTLMLQEVLTAPAWADRLGSADLRALTPLLYGHVNPYGTFQLDMTTRLALAQSA